MTTLALAAKRAVMHVILDMATYAGLTRFIRPRFRLLVTILALDLAVTSIELEARR